jgi:hypothetical protein
MQSVVNRKVLKFPPNEIRFVWHIPLGVLTNNFMPLTNLLQFISMLTCSCICLLIVLLFSDTSISGPMAKALRNQ